MKCCAFCPTEAKKLSGEHIWDDWLNRALPTKRFRVRQRFSQLDPFRQYDAVALKEKLSVVCETCNNKWMSDVSNRAKKVLHEMVVAGKRTILFQADLRVVAAFGFMKCVVGDHATRGEDPFFSRAARERFRTSLTIPSEVQMWIAAFQGAYRYSGKFTTSLLAPSEPGPLEGIEFYSHTYVIGHLVLQTLAPGWKRVHDRAPRSETAFLLSTFAYASPFLRLPTLRFTPAHPLLAVHYDCFFACNSAPRTAARKVSAAAGGGTWPNRTSRVFTLRP